MSHEQKKVIEVLGAEKSFGAIKALNGVQFHVYQGERLALLGPNGAGKTTTVRALSGRVHLDQGSLQLLGQPLQPGRIGVRSQLGVVPQEIALYDFMTGSENLNIFGKMNGVKGDELRHRVQWALDWTGLSQRAGQKVSGYSGGMKRRLNIAAAVLHTPSVIILDEPTVGVDPQSRERIWQMLNELRDEGASLVLTTHQLDEAQSMCDRIVILDHGRTIADGTLEQLIQQTVGDNRQVVIHSENGETLRHEVGDIGRELPILLADYASKGIVIRDLQVVTANLQAVFLQLTGRELRES